MTKYFRKGKRKLLFDETLNENQNYLFFLTLSISYNIYISHWKIYHKKFKYILYVYCIMYINKVIFYAKKKSYKNHKIAKDIISIDIFK